MQAEKEVSLSTQGPVEEGLISNQNSNPNIASSASISVAQFPGILQFIQSFCLFLELSWFTYGNLPIGIVFECS